MSWRRRATDQPPEEPVGQEEEQVHAPPPELEEARQRLRRELSRADRAIQRAMAHADEVFQPPSYRGPERRRSAR